MTRLVNATRKSIVDRTIDAQFKERREILRKESNRLAQMVHAEKYGDDLAKVRKLDSSWFDGGLKFRTNAAGLTIIVTSDELLPIKHGCNPHWSVFATYLIGDPMCNELHAFAEQKKQLDDDVKAATTALYQVVNSVNTFEKLREIWPEGEKFYTELQPDSNKKAYLPAVQIREVNEMLGLA